MSASWQQLGSISPVELQETRLYLQYALQWVERAALCTIAPDTNPDTAPTQPLLTWQPAKNGFFSQPYRDNTQIGLTLTDGEAFLTFGKASETATPATASAPATATTPDLQTFALNGHTDAEARLWVREQIEDSALDTTEYNDPSSLPQHPLAEGARYKLSEQRENILEIARWFSNAHMLLSTLQEKTDTIACSLEHFSIYLDKSGLELGLSLGDIHYKQPYFYATSNPPWQSQPDFSHSLSGFHKKDFAGFVLPSEQITHLQDQETASLEFLREASQLTPEQKINLKT